MLKNLSVAMMLSVLVLASCGGGGGSGGVDCDAYCAKGVECEPSADLAECKTYCANFNKLINSSFGSAVMTCTAGSCQQMESCVQSAMQSCNGNIDSFLTRLCNKQIACQGGGATVEQCKAALQGQSSMAFMKCLSSWALNTLAGCAEAASCNNFEAEMNACAESKLGIDMGGSDD